MNLIAEWLWNPFLSLIYIELGIVFVVLTRGVVFKKAFSLLQILWQKSSAETGNTISHKKALMASLATTVGVGNLAGVGTAIHLGGPGALFWMWVSAILGMSFRMVSTYMSIKHSPESVDSPFFGTPMAYMQKFTKRPFNFIAPAMAVLIIIKGQVAANMIQSNSVAHAIHNEWGVSQSVVAILLALAVGSVIIGGMQKIIDVSSKIAPWMIVLYLIAGLSILLLNPLDTLTALGDVFHYAFSSHSVRGGLAGYTVLQALQFGTSRGVFSHASGIGIAPFLQGVNKDHPAVGAFMAAVTPLVDTLVICTVTGLIVISGKMWPTLTGAWLTAQSFNNGLGTVGYLVVSACIIIFAFTTIIGWSYYSEKCYVYLGGKNIRWFRFIFVFITFLGPFLPLTFVWSLGDVLIGALLLMNLIPLSYIMAIQLSTMSKDLSSQDIDWSSTLKGQLQDDR